MKIGLIGMGYVGTINAVCLANVGHEVMCWDTNDKKMRDLRAGLSPVPISDIKAKLREHVKNGHIRIAVNIDETILPCNVTYICVGTPKNQDLSANMDGVERVTSMIGTILQHRQSLHHTIVYRSTIPPGNYDGLMLRMLTAFNPGPEFYTKDQAVQSFTLVAYPEFLRQEHGVEDFFSPILTLVGCKENLVNRQYNPLMEIIDSLGIGHIQFTDFDTAMMVKYAANAMHACKIVFANSIAEASDALNVDGSKVMGFVENLSKKSPTQYLKPGLPYGGRCLEKDLQSLTREIHLRGIRTSFLRDISQNNKFYAYRLGDVILRTGAKSVGFYGMGFTANSEDLTNSPSMALMSLCSILGLCVYVIDTMKSDVSLKDLFPDCVVVEFDNYVLKQFDVIVTNDTAATFEGFTVLESFPNLHVKTGE